MLTTRLRIGCRDREARRMQPANLMPWAPADLMGLSVWAASANMRCRLLGAWPEFIPASQEVGLPLPSIRVTSSRASCASLCRPVEMLDSFCFVADRNDRYGPHPACGPRSGLPISGSAAAPAEISRTSSFA